VLALWQANWVASRLKEAGETCELVPMDTTGDRMLSVSIPEIGSKGVFTFELEQELQNGNIDLAVHSAKDMPSELPEGFEIIAYTPRENPHDVLLTNADSIDLTQKIKIGTSSTRRQAMLSHYYPHVECAPVRGNLNTRIKKMMSGEFDALLLAFAGVHRLGFDEMIKYTFPLKAFVPAVGQGSMAVEVSSTIDAPLRRIIRAAINDPKAELCLLAERSFLHSMQGGCSIPVFAHASWDRQKITMQAGVVSLDGQQLVQFSQSADPDEVNYLGKSLAQKVLSSGGEKILNEIKEQQNHNDQDQA
jgi:hydroxymethylbilane synthase